MSDGLGYYKQNGQWFHESHGQLTRGSDGALYSGGRVVAYVDNNDRVTSTSAMSDVVATQAKQAGEVWRDRAPETKGFKGFLRGAIQIAVIVAAMWTLGTLWKVFTGASMFDGGRQDAAIIGLATFVISGFGGWVLALRLIR